jgi:tripartite-type tricarboxylate transporter receptor subunit TctC
MVHVPYKATQQALTDLTTGQVQMMFPTTTAVLPQINAGRLRGLAITSRERSALAPALPTLEESGLPGYEASIWNGLLAPARTPPAVVAKLHENLVAVLQAPEVRERFATLGASPVTNTPAAFGNFIAEEITKWGKVVREAGVRID